MPDPRATPPPADPDDRALKIIRFDEIHEPESVAGGAGAHRGAGNVEANAGPAGTGLARRDALAALENLTSEHVVESVHPLGVGGARNRSRAEEWTFDRSLAVSESDASGCSIRCAREFIDTFPAPAGGSVSFVLIVSHGMGEMRLAA